MKKNRLLIITIGLIFSFCSNNHDYTYRSINISGLEKDISIVAAGDIFGSGKDELILGIDSTVFIYDSRKDSALLLFSVSFIDDILEMEVGDADNDNKNELVIIAGQRRYVETDVKVYVVQFVEDEWHFSEVYSKFSPRPQPTGLIIADINNDNREEIIVSYFESKYIVETVSVSFNSGEWENKIIASERMAMTRDIGVLPDGEQNRIVVGRVYGDALGDVGDAYIADENKTDLPVKRGVKIVKIGDGNNDGENEIFVGDGWHQDYGKVARGRISYLFFDEGKYKYELIEDVKYQYEISQIEIQDVTGDGKNEVLSRGNRIFKIYKYDEKGWKVFADTIISNTQFSVGDIYGDKHPEVIFTGENVQIYNFADPDFSYELDEEVVTELTHPDSLLGKPAPELIVAKWYNGNFGRLSNYRGKVILLDFWATWCKPCIKMFPDLKKLQEKYPDNLQIFGLTRLDNRQTINAVEDFINKENFVYPIALSEESFNNLLYGVGAIPHTVLIDKKGIVRNYKIGLDDGSIIEKEIIKLINE